MVCMVVKMQPIWADDRCVGEELTRGISGNDVNCARYRLGMVGKRLYIIENTTRNEFICVLRSSDRG